MQHDRQYRTVCNETAPHNSMSETLLLILPKEKTNLSQVICSAESQERDCSKAHLHPTHNRGDFANRSMTQYCSASNISINSAFKVKFKVYPENDLYSEQ